MNRFELFKERIKKNFKENKVLLFVFVAIWVLCLVFTLNYYKNTLGKESYGPETFDEVITLDNETVVEQIVSSDVYTETISLKLATFARKNSGNINIVVTGMDSNHVYLNKNISVSRIIDNDYATYSFDKGLTNSNDKKIKITITSDSDNQTAAGLYVSNTKVFSASKLKISNENIEGEICLKFLTNNDNYALFTKIALYASIILLTLLILILVLIKPEIEKVFVLFGAIFGLLLMLVISPGAAPDELLHYEKTLQLSNFIMFEDPKTIDAEYVNYDSYADHVNVSDSYNRFIRDFNKPLKLKNKMSEFKHEFNDTYMGCYIPQTIGVTIARLLKVNSMKTFYSGRIINLIFYLVCMYIALKNTPIRKMLLGIISIIPICIQQAASYSYDVYINGLVLISISFLFKWLAKDEQITKKDYFIVLCISLLLAPAKVIYGIFTLLYCFVPAYKFGSKKNKILSILILCMPTIVLLVYNMFIRTIGMLMDSMNIESINLLDNGTGTAELIATAEDNRLFNILYIVKHPLETLQVIYRTIRFYLSTWFYQSLGRCLAGTNLVIPMFIIRTVLICVGIASLRKDDYILPISVKVAFVVVCIIIAMFVLISMLTGWTKRSDTMINGVQGRYFIPLLPYFFSIFGNSKIKLPRKLDIYVIYTMILVYFEIIVYVLSFTFVN